MGLLPPKGTVEYSIFFSRKVRQKFWFISAVEFIPVVTCLSQASKSSGDSKSKYQQSSLVKLYSTFYSLEFCTPIKTRGLLLSPLLLLNCACCSCPCSQSSLCIGSRSQYTSQNSASCSLVAYPYPITSFLKSYISSGFSARYESFKRESLLSRVRFVDSSDWD